MSIPWQDHLIKDDDVHLPDDYVEDPDYVAAPTALMEPIGPSAWMVRASVVAREEEEEEASRAAAPEEDHYDDEDDDESPPRVMSAAGAICAMTSDPAKMSRESTEPDDDDPVCVVVALQSAGGAWIWNPGNVDITRALKVEIAARCGDARHLVMPTAASSANATRLKKWSSAFPMAKLYVTPDRKPEPETEDAPPLIFDFLLSEDPKRDYVLDIDQVIFRGGSGDEVVFFHKPSGVIMVSDMISCGDAATDGSPALRRALAALLEPTGMPVPGGRIRGFIEDDDDDAEAAENGEATAATRNAEPAKAYFTPYSRRWSSWWRGADVDRPYRTAVTKIVDGWKPTGMVLGTSGHRTTRSVDRKIRSALSWIDTSIEEPVYDHSVPAERFGRLQRETWSTGVGAEKDDDGDSGEFAAAASEVAAATR